eukprot:2367660-Pleurochrysis_carterae.AAC.1
MLSVSFHARTSRLRLASSLQRCCSAASVARSRPKAMAVWVCGLIASVQGSSTLSTAASVLGSSQGPKWMVDPMRHGVPPWSARVGQRAAASASRPHAAPARNVGCDPMLPARRHAAWTKRCGCAVLAQSADDRHDIA